MPWFVYAWIALIAIGVLLAIAKIGQPREPYTPGFAVLSLIMGGLQVWGLIYLATR